MTAPTTARVRAQAKLNLVLRVLARETTGYHQVESVLCRIDLADEVVVRVVPRGRTLHCTGERLPRGGLGPLERNLAWRAAGAYASVAGWPEGFAIEIDKRIPVGGGLGGGSADAGAVLRALNALNPSPLPAPALLGLAGSLGADVPFLTQDQSPLALAWGRGEHLLALPPLPERACWLFCPDVSVATAEAYGWLADLPPHRAPVLYELPTLGSWEGIARIARNDFEDVVAARHPVIARTLSTLRSPGAEGLLGADALVQLTGTGSTIYALLGGDRRDAAAWRSDEPGLDVLQTSTATRVEPVIVTD
ncbi:MAG TPA: 4-(cytidine 5'-diphospho)-2-C-methyl-D-erythritol kinase [Gemmatimonadaceae bacterium]